MILILLGPPGSGKGTQAKLIEKELGLVHISTGDILRRAVTEGTPLGREAKGYLDAGDLVPDRVVIDLVADRLGNGDGRGFLLDGFPRTVAQAEGLDTVLGRDGKRVDRVVSIRVGKEELLKRLAGRSAAEGRSDDSHEVIANRLEVYERETRPLVGFYGKKSVLVEVDGEQTVGDVFAEIRQRISADGQ
jgi:adenylate kinase